MVCVEAVYGSGRDGEAYAILFELDGLNIVGEFTAAEEVPVKPRPIKVLCVPEFIAICAEDVGIV